LAFATLAALVACIVARRPVVGWGLSAALASHFLRDASVGGLTPLLWPLPLITIPTWSYVLAEFTLFGVPLRWHPAVSRQDGGKGACRILFCVINLGEVLYIIERERSLAQAREVLALIDHLPVIVLPATRDAVLAAAHVKAWKRTHALLRTCPSRSGSMGIPSNQVISSQ
jgi:hypothetical protein